MTPDAGKATMREIVFLDCETGGLNPETNPVIEVAWQRLTDNDPKSLRFPHNPKAVRPEAAKINGYYERGLDDANTWARPEEIRAFVRDLVGVTICGANPAFDAAMLGAWWLPAFGYGPGNPPWHYRMLDVEAMAYGVLGTDEVLGLSSVASLLRDQGFTIPVADHTAEGDVRTTKAVYTTLRYLSLAKRAAA